MGRSTVHSLVEFHHRYPSGSLVADLLQIHEGLFVVKATLQAGGTTLATGMSAATTLEQAEDLARQRALAVLGIYVPDETKAELIDRAAPLPGHFPRQLNPAPSDRPRQSRPAPSQDEEWPDLSMPPEEPALPFNEPEPESVLNPTSRRRSTPSPASTKKTAASKAPPRPDPVDFSDEIAQTTVEMKRLGWDDSKGRACLLERYGKRSRQQLSDAELLDFLEFLQEQPSPGEPEF
ncbi:hypothetical protein L3556_02510 [Candidatus Synechococcus calcipolaris G9]|uniref:DRBM domain-containing protein n=1 Tax=Candidatus Synechococcus calcipolaris G9 TaxID=1497997 RepID=A0ABT6EVI5_9SYNE|nr:hypothetical protein [Candidatus Synechococcus calcipolaris]MDG2989814.1 hypothetical protein [Candidatus Synechococcus calcipolaris G9]